MSIEHHGREGPVSGAQRELTIRAYLRGLELASYEQLRRLFDREATIESPLYGVQLATEFYRELLKDTDSSVIQLKNVFHNTSGINQSIGYFHYDWTLKDGSQVAFDCCDVFYFNGEGQIRHLKIVYDTFLARAPHSRVSSGIGSPGSHDDTLTN